MESSKEIRKLFYQDSYEKKKIGANVFKKASAGTERAGVAGGLIFPKYNYKRYEKNSKVKERNVFKEIVDYNTFKDFSEDKQRKLLKVWMDAFTNKEIFEGMGIGEKKFYKLRNKLGVKRGVNIVLNNEDIEKMKSGDIDLEKFKLLPNDKKFEIVSYIQETKNLTNKQMAKLLGYSPNSFSSNKSNWKKAYEEKHKEKESDVSMHDNDSFLIVGEDEENNMMIEQKNNEEEQGVKKKVDAVDDIKLKLTENSLQQSFEFNLAGKYVGDDLNSILKGLAVILQDDKKYDVKLMIKEN